MKLGFPFGISIIFWSVIGLIRYISEELYPRIKNKKKIYKKRVKSKVAACVPAHNEGESLTKTINSIKRNIPSKDIYVVSDGSTDNTAKIARKLGCNVLELNPGRGKSKALMALITKYKILNEYEFLIIVDADTMLNRNYVKGALDYFSRNEDMVALAAYALPFWRNYKRIKVSDYIAAYRTRLYRVLQWLLMYGQTWRYTNVNPVIPGFAAMYRTKTLKKLRLSIPGIWIEDFSLAFQIHSQKLGKIAHHPNVYAVYEDPQTVLDYCKQVRRWNVGFYQTVRYFGMWPSMFWVSLALFTFEVLLFSAFMLILPIVILLLFIQLNAPIFNPSLVEVSDFVSRFYGLWEIFVAIFLIDYFFTVFVALKDKKYMLLFYGLGFFVFNYLTSLILLFSLSKGLFGKSKGIWTPVKRK